MLFLLVLLSSALGAWVREPPVPEVRTRSQPVDGWVTVRLNHFDASNTETFQMRYYYNNEFATTNNIVIFVGGEWAISPGWVTGGLAHELAQKTGAGLFYTEHRYYGQTRPTNGTSVAELRFLTVDQALADLAQFIQYVQSDYFDSGRFRGGKVSLVGCSYAGSMATWMRLAYPHLVTAAFSDSGPLHAQEDFPEYLEVIAEALRVQGSHHCVESIAESVQKVHQELKTEAGAARISRLFNTCSPINGSDPLDVATFFWFGVTETFAYLVQYATPGDIATACAVLTDVNVSDPSERLANWITQQSWTQPCIQASYAAQVAAHTNTSYDAQQAVMRLWTYQTCVEYGWYQTTNGEEHPFLSTVPLSYFHRMCRDFFGDNFDENFLRQGIKRTNLLFGGLTFMPDGVVSRRRARPLVAGGHDPWSPMGPNATHATPLAPVYVASQVSHCRAIRSTKDSETEQLEVIKQSVLRNMQEFLAGKPPTTPDSSAAILTPVLFTLIVTFVSLVL
ncbi:LOW QUALITY PROTEIN: putative serine protease F56F10.1 [Battus philenor]|uniref:LOW QUALITY PROTEIN: putative serine protease F56F10.1 n=1 Tax=Battus philenor TaxID=42288 RepID=UPI0035CE8950